MSAIFTTSLLDCDPSEFAERVFQFKGTLVVCGASAILKLGDPESERLSIIDPTFLDRILNAVPCYVGGECLYNDAVQFQGRISLCDGKMAVSAVESGQLSREGEGEYNF